MHAIMRPPSAEHHTDRRKCSNELLIGISFSFWPLDERDSALQQSRCGCSNKGLPADGRCGPSKHGSSRPSFLATTSSQLIMHCTHTAHATTMRWQDRQTCQGGYPLQCQARLQLPIHLDHFPGKQPLQVRCQAIRLVRRRVAGLAARPLTRLKSCSLFLAAPCTKARNPSLRRPR